MQFAGWIGLPCLAIILSSSMSVAEETGDEARQRLFVELASRMSDGCHDCHFGEDAEGGFSMEGLETLTVFDGQREPWRKIRHRVQAREMPPKGHELADQEAYEWIVATIDELWATGCDGDLRVGPTPLRRLTRHEYSMTLRDLLGIHIDVGHRLPAEGGGGEGFDNAAETLFLSPIHAEQYLEAAREALDYALRDPRTRRRVLIEPDGQRSPGEAARETLQQFGRRAFRRPVRSEELDRFLGLFQSVFDESGDFDGAIGLALRAILVHPHFLFRMEEPNEGTEPRPVNDYELATRLSYFLGSTTPDETLLDLAEAGRLHETDVLREQVTRLLKDPKSLVFAERFVGQWLGIQEWGRSIKPDPERFPWLTDEILSAMRYEPFMLWQHVFQENRPLTDLIDADYAFLNNHMVRLYGLEDQIDEALREQPLKVALPADTPRGGVLTSAAVLGLTSYPNRTSPVLRGKWILENVLDLPPPPPPPNVPALDDTTATEKAATVRQRLEQHRQDPVCASCHDRIDPIGFTLEHFDQIGRWRDEDGGQPIDDSGEMTNGERLDGVEGLKATLLADPDRWVEPLVRKLLGYALGRGLVEDDLCTVQHIVERVRADEYRSQTLIWEIVQSPAFRMQAPETIEPVPEPANDPAEPVEMGRGEATDGE